MIRILITLAVPLVLYFAFAFAAWDWNPADWSYGQRGFLAMFSVWGMSVAWRWE